jgi:hypothetical protein
VFWYESIRLLRNKVVEMRVVVEVIGYPRIEDIQREGVAQKDVCIREVNVRD